MTEVADPARTDTADMLAVHQVFRRALPAAGLLVGGVARGDTARSELVGSFYANILDFLHVHHEGEDLIVTPRLLERAPGAADLVGRVAAQHQTVVPLMETARRLVGPWAASADPEQGAELVHALTALDRELVAHLDEEEAAVLPLCAVHLSPEEWGQLPAHGLGNFGGDKVWLVLGLIRENMTQEQRDEMLAHMPPPAVEMWTTMGSAAFDGFVADLRRPS